MDPRLVRGRRFVLAVIAATIAGELISIVVHIIQGDGWNGLWDSLARVPLTLVLCACLYRGDPWARWVTGILMGVGSALFLLFGPSLVSDGTAQALTLLMGLVDGVVAAILLLSPDVRAYFRRSVNPVQEPVGPSPETDEET